MRASASLLNVRLNLAFGAIAITLLLTLGAALLVIARLGDLMETTRSTTIPHLLDALHLSEQGTRLAAALPSLVASTDPAGLEARWAEIEAIARRINGDLGNWGLTDNTDASDHGIGDDVARLTSGLQALHRATGERLDLAAAGRAALADLRRLQADLADTISPVVYGVGSLAQLFARRDARGLSQRVAELGPQRIERLLALEALVQALDLATATPPAGGLLQGAIDHALAALAPGSSSEPETILRDGLGELARGRSLDGAELAALRVQAKRLADTERTALGGDLAEVTREVRTAIPKMMDQSADQIGHALGIKADGNLLLSLLLGAGEVDELEELASLQDRYARGLEGFCEAARGFAAGPLAERNPILTGNVLAIQERLRAAGAGPNGLFDLRGRHLRLALEIDKRVVEVGALASHMGEHIGTLVDTMESETRRTQGQILAQRGLGQAVLLGASASGFVLIGAIAWFTTHALGRDEVALRRAQADTEAANRILDAVAFSARHLLGAESWDAAVDAVLERLGEAAGASRAYLFQLRPDTPDGALVIDLRREWAAPGVPSRLGDAGLIGVDVAAAGLGPLTQRLLGGETVAGPLGHLPEGTHSLLVAAGAKSALFAPISVNRLPWGFLGMHDCEYPRVWSTSEIDAIAAAADALGAAVARDRTARDLRQAAAVFQSTKEGILITDAQSRIVTVNPAFSAITGYSPDEMHGQTPAVLASGHHPPEFFAEMHRTLDREGQWQGEILNRRKDGGLIPSWMSITAVRQMGGQTLQYVCVFSDITAIKRSEEQLDFLAHHDTLTQLPNRALLRDRLRRAIAQARRSGGRIAVLFIDLDRFKNINDSLGHDVGDALLQEVAHRIEALLREGDTIARQGGDEFIALLEDVRDADAALRIAEHVLRAVRQSFQIKGHRLYVSASIGVSLYPNDGSCEDDLIRNADTAMYKAKEAGKNTVRLYTEASTADAQARLGLAGPLRQALGRRDFDV